MCENKLLNKCAEIILILNNLTDFKTKSYIAKYLLPKNETKMSQNWSQIRPGTDPKAAGSVYISYFGSFCPKRARNIGCKQNPLESGPHFGSRMAPIDTSLASIGHSLGLFGTRWAPRRVRYGRNCPTLAAPKGL